MNTGWRRFLEGIGASVRANLDVDFPSGRPLSGDQDQGGFVLDLSWLSLIEVEGTDATEFLNAQFTSDIKLLPDNSFQYSAWCNPKGRVIAIFVIYRKQNSYHILIPTELKDSLIKRLGIYVLRSQVVIHDRSEEISCLGIITTGQSTSLPSIPDKSGNIRHSPDYSVLRMTDSAPLRLLAVGAWTRMIELWRTLEKNYVRAGTGLWHYYDIKAGIPWLTGSTSEQFLPQEINLDILDGLSYTKGCFPGQEVIARVHYRGSVKQRLHYCEATQNTSHPERGDKLYGEEPEASVGTVIDAADSGQGYFGILAVVDIAKAGSDLHLGTSTGMPLRFHAR